MGFLKRWFTKLDKKSRYILFGSIAGVIVIACVLILGGIFHKKNKGPKYDIPEVPDGYVLVFRLVSEYDVYDGQKTPITLCEYDDHGNLLLEKVKYRNSGYADFDRITEYTLNESGRPVRIKTSYASGDVRTEEREYDPDARQMKAEISEAGTTETHRYQYDERGILILEEHFGENGRLSESIAFESDENGLLVCMDQKVFSDIELSRETVVRWDRRPTGTLEKLSYLERMYDVYGVSSETEQVSLFDSQENQIAEYRIQDGNKVDEAEYECTYDEDGRLKQMIGPGGITDYYEYDKKGRVVSVESWDITRHYEYDSHGNVIKEYTTDAGQDSAEVKNYTEYVYKPFAVRKDLLTDEERDKLGIN